MKDKYRKSILLIGPMSVGKTTISEALASHYKLPLIDLDELRKEYYAKMPDYSREVSRTIFQSGGDLHAYFEPFETRQVEMLLDLEDSGVFDFGGGHTVKSDLYFPRIQAAFEPYENVIFLTVSPDQEKTIQSLHFTSREGIQPHQLDQYNLMNRKFIESDCNARLAKRTVYRDGKTVEQTLEEIIAWIDEKETISNK